MDSPMAFFWTTWAITLALSSWIYTNVHATTNLQLGILVPIDVPGPGQLGEGLIAATGLAIKKVYDEGFLNGNFSLNFTTADTACNKLKAIEKVYELSHVDAFIGPACSSECLSSGLLATSLNKPMISYSCSSLELSDRLYYSTFARTQPYTRTYASLTPFLMHSVLMHYKWKKICIISTEDQIWAPLAVSLKTYINARNVSTRYMGVFTPSSNLDYRNVLQPATKVCRGKLLFYSILSRFSSINVKVHPQNLTTKFQFNL